MTRSIATVALLVAMSSAGIAQDASDMSLTVCASVRSIEPTVMVVEIEALPDVPDVTTALTTAEPGELNTFRAPVRTIEPGACTALGLARVVALEATAAVHRRDCEARPSVAEDMSIVEAPGVSAVGQQLLVLDGQGTIVGPVVAVSGSYLLLSRPDEGSVKSARAAERRRLRGPVHEAGVVASGITRQGDRLTFVVGGDGHTITQASALPAAQGINRTVVLTEPFFSAAAGRCWH